MWRPLRRWLVPRPATVDALPPAGWALGPATVRSAVVPRSVVAAGRTAPLLPATVRRLTLRPTVTAVPFGLSLVAVRVVPAGELWAAFAPPAVVGPPTGRGPLLDPNELFARDFFARPTMSRSRTVRLLRAVAALGPLVEGEVRRRDIPAADRPRFERLRNRLVVGHLRLVAGWVNREPGLRTLPGLAPADLFQAGVFGLMRAVELFDPDRGTLFSTYAVQWVRQAVQRAVQSQSRLIRVPSHLQTGPDRLPAADLLRFVRLWPLHDALPDPKAPDPTVLAADAGAAREAVVRRLLTTLQPRLGHVLTRRFGLDGDPPETLQQLADRLGLTRERVRQLEVAALKRLAAPRHRAALEAVGGD